MKPGMSKRGLRGANLDQLEKNLEEAFAILDSLGVSNVSEQSLIMLVSFYKVTYFIFQIKRSPSSGRMNSLEEAIKSFPMSKRSINNEKLATLEAKYGQKSMFNRNFVKF